MKKIPILFILFTLGLYAGASEAETKTNENTDTVITKEITATNKQQLDVKEIDTEELLLKNQNLESSSVEITGEGFKEGEDKVKVKTEQTTQVVLEQELSQGVEKKSFFRKIIDFFTGE